MKYRRCRVVRSFEIPIPSTTGNTIIAHTFHEFYTWLTLEQARWDVTQITRKNKAGVEETFTVRVEERDTLVVDEDHLELFEDVPT